MLDEKDISILDDIINMLVASKTTIYENALRENAFFDNFNSFDFHNECFRIFKTIENEGCGKIIPNNIQNAINSNENTLNFKNSGGFKILFEKRQEILKETERQQKIKSKKLEDDAKLSDWQVKAFPYVFSVGLIGGIYSIFSILILLTGESTEEKIQRILESKMKERQKTEQVLVVPLHEKNATLKK